MKGTTRERQHRRAWTRGAMPLALLCLVLQLGSAGHLLLAPHSICPEHGEIVDGQAPHAAAHALPVGRRARVSTSTSQVEAAAHEHDHCLLAQDRRERVLAARQGLRVAARPPSLIHQLPVEHEQARPPLAVIFVAPKSSPPAPVV